MLVDRFGRALNYLRASVTLRCNYRCVFCHREGIRRVRQKELSVEDYKAISIASYNIGIRFVKLTGGEPLLRDDIHEIVKVFSTAGHKVSIVTNGSLLHDKIDSLVNAGLAWINVSLLALNREKYRYLTGGGDLDKVLKGIKRTVEKGVPVTINYLVLSENIRDFEELLKYSWETGVEKLRVIELIPLGIPPKVFKKLHTKITPIINKLEKLKNDLKIRDFQSRPIYILPNGLKVEVLIGYGNPSLCAKCTRIRLTPDGKLKTCLFREEPSVDLLPILESNLSLEEKVQKIEQAFVKANNLREPFFK